MNDKEFIASIRDQCNQQLGGGGASPPGSAVPTITTKPAPFANLGTHNGKPAETRTAANQPVAVDFVMVKNSTARALKFFASSGGQNWNRYSWAIFDSGGGRVFGEDNQTVSGTLGSAVPENYLNQLGPGTYTLAVAVDVGSTPQGPNLAFQLVQHPY